MHSLLSIMSVGRALEEGSRRLGEKEEEMLPHKPVHNYSNAAKMGPQLSHSSPMRLTDAAAHGTLVEHVLVNV